MFELIKNLKSMALHSVISTSNPKAGHVAVEMLKRGSVIAVPTDTVYGLACDATNMTSIGRLYEIKSRNEEKPVAICLSEPSEVKTWAKIEHLPKGLLETLLPGPVTLVLTCANKLDKSLSINGKVGIRVPDYDFIRQLASGLGRPLALTSANLSSEPSSLTIHEFEPLWGKVRTVFNGGSLGGDESRRLASTVVDLSELGRFTIVRKGVAAVNTIEVLQKFGLSNRDKK